MSDNTEWAEIGDLVYINTDVDSLIESLEEFKRMFKNEYSYMIIPFGKDECIKGRVAKVMDIRVYTGSISADGVFHEVYWIDTRPTTHISMTLSLIKLEDTGECLIVPYSDLKLLKKKRG